MLTTLLSILVVAVVVGSSAALLALAFGLVANVLGETNLAFGDAIVLAACVAAATWSATGRAVLSVLAGLACGSVTAAAVDRLVVARVRGRAHQLLAIVATLGAALVVRNVAEAAFGVEDRPFPALLQGAHLAIAGTSIDLTLAATVAVLLLATLGAAVGIPRTSWGRAVVATRNDPVGAQLTGVPTTRIATVLYGLSGALGSVAALLFFAHVGGISTTQGFRFTLTAYTATALGGRSLVGPVTGGLVVGLAVATVQVLAGALWTLPVTVSLLVLALLARPQGLSPGLLVHRV